MESNHAMHDDTHLFHPDDSAKQSEHRALLDLVPHSAATHRAVRDGSWFDASTWEGGRIPAEDARVLIPRGISVVYDGESDASLKTVRVDGSLAFATDRDTTMVVDTFVTDAGSRLQIGARENPIQADKQARIIIADAGAIDLNWDPQQLSRGIVSHGAVEIHGAEKTTHLKLAEDAMAGDTALTLAEVPEGWQPGDRLVLTGTRYLRDKWDGSKLAWQGTQDEELTIKAIEGNTVLLEQALKYDHDTPRGSLKASLANYSRNVVIETENHDDLPASQRGHVMFMHNDDVDVRYAEFQELGRTDKSKLIDDFVMKNGKRVLDADGNPIKNDPEDITNQRGRYAVHFHRTGVDDINGKPAMVVGNAVWGSPGLGYVHHDSHVVMEDNAAYDVFGAAFVTETGNEIGAWRNNIAIKSEGMRSISKSGERVNNQDIAHNGTGFWFQGRLVENEGNIAAGQRHAGITYLLRGVDQKDVLAQNLPNPEVARYSDTLGVGKPAINGFRDNEVLTSGMGLEVIKANPRQRHDVRSVIDGFTAWEVRTGTHLEYTSKYTLKDITVLGAASGAGGGIEFGNNAEDMVVNGAHVEGFKTGVKFKKNHTFDDFNGDWQYVLIDTALVNNTTDYENLDPAKDKILTGDDLVQRQLTFTPDAAADFVLSPDRGDREVVITGTKTDSLGTVALPTGSDSLEFGFHKGLKQRLQQGYFIDANGTRFFTVDELFADRATGEIIKQSYVVTLTDDWNQFTLGGTLKDVPVLGTYDGTVTPGVMPSDLRRWIEENTAEPVSQETHDHDHVMGDMPVDGSDSPDHTNSPDHIESDDMDSDAVHGESSEASLDEASPDEASPDDASPDTGDPDPSGTNSEEPGTADTEAGADDDSLDTASAPTPGAPEAETDNMGGDATDSDGSTHDQSVGNLDGGGEHSGEHSTDGITPSPISMPMESIRIEAEDLDLSGYRRESVKGSGASGSEHISLKRVAGGSGTAFGIFNGEAGTYQVKVHYFDENDGQSAATVTVGEKSQTLTFDKDLPNGWAKPASLTHQVTHETIALKPGDRFEIKGQAQGGEFARFDAIEFSQVAAAPKVADSAPPTAPAPSPLQVQAETMELSGAYRVESIGAAVGNEVISLRGGANTDVGSASLEFSGSSGTYDITLAYFDENDGIGQLTLKRGDQTLSEITLDQQLGSRLADHKTATTREIKGVSLSQGDRLTLIGVEDGSARTAEHARVDYIEFRPAAETTTLVGGNPANTDSLSGARDSLPLSESNDRASLVPIAMPAGGVLEGTPGQDLFQIGGGDVMATIRDFQVGDDQILIGSGQGMDSLSILQVGDNALIGDRATGAVFAQVNGVKAQSLISSAEEIFQTAA